MRIFKRKIQDGTTGVNDKAAGWIANTILKAQQKFADTLGKISSKWKEKQKWIFLYSIWIVFGGLSMVSIINPFSHSSQNLSKPSSIAVPRTIHKSEKNMEVKITESEFQKVQAFRKRIDSLSGSPEGKMKVQRLQTERPGLMDSLAMVEQLYYSQKNK